MTTHSRIEALKSNGHLPSPKGAALQVLILSQQEGTTNQQLAHAIQADPALSLMLIKLANSPLSHLVRPIVSVVDAVAVLGMNTVRQVVLGLSLVEGSRNLACRKFNYQSYWSHSLLTAIVAKNLALLSRVVLASPEEIFVLGLLAKIGSLALATAYPVEYSELLDRVEADVGIKLKDLELKEFGFNHNQLTKEMLADWRMPHIFQASILYFDEPSRAQYAEGGRDWYLLHLLNFADFASGMCLAEEAERDKLVPKLVFKGARMGVESEALVRLIDASVSEWHDWSKLFGIHVIDVPPFEGLLAIAPLAPESIDAGALPEHIGTSFKLRILLVDDDRAVLMVMKMMLDSFGHTVAVARNGVEALAMVNDFMPQIVMTDWIMPEMDGIEFCKALRRNTAWRNIYVFILTVQESTNRLVEAFEAGANDYMTKPVNPKVLGARLGAAQRVVQLQEELEHERQLLHKFSIELTESNQRFQQLALTDELTELPNRRFANEHLERQWAIAQRNSSALSCMMVDIDYFKQVNDTYGHKTGDDVLKQVAHALHLCVRKQDVVCRLGGEEFLVICPDVQEEQVYRYAERLRTKVADLSFSDHASGKKFKLTISIGGASLGKQVLNAEVLLQLADKRLYAAKEAGRNRTVAA